MTKQYIDLLTEHEVKLLCLRERVSSDSSGFSPFSTKKQSVHYRILRSYKDTLHGPSVEIRTRGLLNPIQARYQTSPHPDIQFCFTQPDKNTTSSTNLQALF